jgi:hypothetical protein
MESKKPTATLSKTRFKEICESLTTIIQDDDKVRQVIESIQTILNFDPNIPQYTPEVGKKIKEYRQRLKEEGISTYISSGKKKQYETMKLKKMMVAAN